MKGIVTLLFAFVMFGSAVMHGQQVTCPHL